MSNPFPILQSGFIAPSLKGLALAPVEETSLQEVINFKNVPNPLVEFRYSPEVSELYQNWCTKPDLLKDFDFRARILKAAMVSFGTYNFHGWLLLQNEQPTLSDLHKTFLLETLDYLLGSSERRTSNVSWMRMLDATGSSKAVSVDIRKYFASNAMNAVSTNSTLPTTTRDILQRWVSKERGFEDLLLSLYVIFGDRLHRSTIAGYRT